MPQRVCVSAKVRRAAMEPGVASMSAFEAITNGALVSATPRLMFAPKPRVRSFSITRAPAEDGDPPGLATSGASFGTA